MSFLRSRGGVLRSPVPCWTRWALRGSSGGAPEAPGDAPGGLGEVSGTSREPPGMAREHPTAIFLSAEATSEALWEETLESRHFFEVLAWFLRSCLIDLLLESVLVSVTLESSRGKSDTIEFDDPYEGFATFSFVQEDETAEHTCRETYEFRL